MKKNTKTKPAVHAALASPMRLEIVGSMTDPSPLSISDLAARLGRPATSLYHHVQVLLDAGVFREAGTRPKGKRFETVYELTEAVLDLDVDRQDPQAARDACQTMAAALRMARRDFEAAITRSDVPDDGPGRELLATRMHIRAKAEVLAEINKRLDGIFEYIQSLEASDMEPGPDDHFVSLTMMLAPLRGRRQGNDKGEKS